MKPFKAIPAIICSLLFMLYITGPLIGRMLSLGEQTPEMVAAAEKRPIAVAPSFQASSLRYRDIKQLPLLLEKYLSDTFPYRLNIITELRYLQVLSFGMPNNKGIAGKNNWLFGNNIGGKPIDDYLGMSDLSDDRIRQMIEVLDKKRLFFAERDVKYYFLIAPNKITIHDEMLPDEIRESKGVSFRMKFMETYRRLLDEGIISDFIVDPTERLIEKKGAHGILYYQQDTHWNWMGRMIAGEFLWARVRRDFPELDSYPRLSMSQRSSSADLPSILGIKADNSAIGEAPFPDFEQWANITVLNKKEQGISVEENCYTNNSENVTVNVCMVGDSFLFSFQPLPEALRCTTIWLESRSRAGLISSIQCEKQLLGRKVEIVIEEIVERNMTTLQQTYE